MDDILKCYQIIGVQSGTSPKALKKAYRDLVKRWHPDRFPDDSNARKEAEEKLKAINLAFERIQDHRETLIALAARKSAAADRAPGPRAASTPPRPPPRPRPQAEPKPPPASTNKPPRTQAASSPSAKPKSASRKDSHANWFVGRFRPVSIAAGCAILLAATAVIFLSGGRNEDSFDAVSDAEPMAPLSQIEFRRSAAAQAPDRTALSGVGEVPDSSRLLLREERADGSPTPPVAALDSPNSQTDRRSSSAHTNPLPMRIDAVGPTADRSRPESQPFAADRSAAAESLPADATVSPLLSGSLKAKLIAKAEAPRPLPPKFEETPEGRFRSALRLAQSEGGARDYAEAARLYRLAAEAGHAEAQKNLGFLYVEGKGVPQDSVEAEKWFNKAAAQGIAGAQFASALLAHAQANSSKAAAPREALLRPAALSTNGPLSLSLFPSEGERASGGRERGPFKETMREDLRRAIPQDGPRSPLLKGLGRSNSPQPSPKDSPPFRSSEPADPAAQYELGLRCEKGDGLKPDFAAAAKWYRLAADAGHSAAQKKLGDLYASGQGVAQDFNEARKWYDKAAASGLAGAGLRRVSSGAAQTDGPIESPDSVRSDPRENPDAKKN